jgi:sensor histidine kinase YesM
MEFSMQAITLSSAIALVHFAYYTRTMRERELRAAQLEAQLGRAKLTSLQAQLHPHFLFNTLNAITSMMYEDPAAADRMMTRLSDLLRLTLAESAGLDAPIREEVEWLEHYLAIMRVRYGERLRVRIDVDPTVADVPVPRLILQPLVENAIRHGIAARPGPGTIEIVAVRHGECMRIEVRDDGPGVRDPGEAQRNGGIGLVNTRERLRHAYGDTHAFALTNRAGGGAVATIDVPVMGPRVSMHDGTAIGA